MQDKDIFDFLNGFRVKDTEEAITLKYIKGTITFDEFVKQMDKLKHCKG